MLTSEVHCSEFNVFSLSVYTKKVCSSSYIKTAKRSTNNIGKMSEADKKKKFLTDLSDSWSCH